MFNNQTNSPYLANGMNFRLSPISGVPIVDDAGGTVTNIYIVPCFGGDLISIWDAGASIWKKMQVVDTAIGVPAVADTVYDVFAEDAGAGIVAYTTVAWSSTFLRSVDVSYFGGVRTKTADKSKTYVGSFRTSVAGAVKFEPLFRDIWNEYNRVEMPFLVTDVTDSWVIPVTNTFRQARGSVLNQVRILQGFSDDPVNARVTNLFSNGTLATAWAGIGIDSTTASSASIISTQQNSAGIQCSSNCEFAGFLNLPGSHDFVWLEAADANVTFYGDNGLPTFYQSGLIGSVRC